MKEPKEISVGGDPYNYIGAGEAREYFRRFDERHAEPRITNNVPTQRERLIEEIFQKIRANPRAVVQLLADALSTAISKRI